MNIALAILHADPARGGAERYTVDLAHALAARRHDVSLLASSFAGVDDPVRKVALPAGGATRLQKYLRFLHSLDAHLARHRYDVVHAMLPVRRCDVYHPHAGLAAEAIASGHTKHRGPLRQSLAMLANHINRKRLRFAAVERELLSGERPPVVLCLSEYVKRTVRRHYRNLPEDRLATLFNATDLAKFNPSAKIEAGQAVRQRFGIDAGKVVLLMIAQDFERKGLREAIAAAASIDDPRLVLLVVGKEDAAPYARLVPPSHRDRIIFAGSTTDPVSFYKAADAFVLPTRHDPCSLVVLEALAMGVPVISTVYNGACEIMTDGQHGFVMENPVHVPALAGAMRTMLDDSRRRQMREACLELRPTLAYERHVDELLQVYAGLSPR